MKNVITLTIALVIMFNISYALDFKEIAIIDVNTSELSKKVKYESTQFIFKSKQKTGFHLSFDISEIIKPYINNIPKTERMNLFIIAENPQGESVVVPYSEFDNSLTSITGVLIYKKVTKASGDSIVLQSDIDGNVDMSGLDEQLAHFTSRRRIHLQIKKLSAKEKKRIVKNATIILPKDLTTYRWINGVDKIRIFQYIPPRAIQSGK